VLALPDAKRFTQPRKLALGAVCDTCREFELFDAEKRGFNPPVAKWLRSELRGRLDGLGTRLAHSTHDQLDAPRVQQFVDGFIAGTDARAEQVLQLLILDTSLSQLLHDPDRLH